MTESLRTESGRNVLRMERRLAHPPEKVWRALTTPADLAQWFPAEVRLDLRQGGDVRFVFAGGEAPEGKGVITDLDPPHLLAFTWEDSHLRWELRPDGAGTLLVLENTFDDRYGAASFAAGWHTCIAALGDVLARRPVPQLSGPEAMAGLHDDYVEALGLDEGTAETTAEGWRVRFERQMTRPVPQVWAALAGPAPIVVGDPAPATLTMTGLPAGAVTEAKSPGLVEYAWLRDGTPAGRVRMELGDGTGQGARLVLVQTGSTADPGTAAAECRTALAGWRTRLAAIAADLRR
jgi:uncharacterized protein YndB with AHSA1/START domain